MSSQKVSSEGSGRVMLAQGGEGLDAKGAGFDAHSAGRELFCVAVEGTHRSCSSIRIERDACAFQEAERALEGGLVGGDGRGRHGRCVGQQRRPRVASRLRTVFFAGGGRLKSGRSGKESARFGRAFGWGSRVDGLSPLAVRRWVTRG